MAKRRSPRLSTTRLPHDHMIKSGVNKEKIKSAHSIMKEVAERKRKQTPSVIREVTQSDGKLSVMMPVDTSGAPNYLIFNGKLCGLER